MTNNATPTGGFDMNRPTIISLLYLANIVLGISAIVGVVLAYVWKGEPGEAWEATHYEYNIKTFWIGLIGFVAGFILMIVLIGFLIWIATGILFIVRSVLSLINAQKREPMPTPGSWLI